MGTSIKTRIVKIGNSQGIRIPKILLEQSGISEGVEIVIQDNSLILRAILRSRSGWEDKFMTMAKEGDDALVDSLIITDWDNSEWEW